MPVARHDSYGALGQILAEIRVTATSGELGYGQWDAAEDGTVGKLIKLARGWASGDPRFAECAGTDGARKLVESLVQEFHDHDSRTDAAVLKTFGETLELSDDGTRCWRTIGRQREVVSA